MSLKIKSAESVCEGHPDKLCDLIADRILDACLQKDRNSRVAVEVLATAGIITVAGEITTEAHIDYENCVKDTLDMVGYDSAEYKIVCKIHSQSADIDGGVSKDGKEIGAGDQGVVYGYACDETPEMLPLPVVLANKITKTLDYARHTGAIKGIKPDGKSLVSVLYDNDKPIKIDTIIISVQHDEGVSLIDLYDSIKSFVFPRVFTELAPDDDTKIHINPSGRFVLGGPEADTGLTGRKLMVDSYGGLAHHGGGAFSGKDATKVDRSGAYMARWVAKNIVAARIAAKAEVCITYAIGKTEPENIDINTFGTSLLSDEQIMDIVKRVFSFNVADVINQLKLRKPLFSVTTNYGHFSHDCMEYEKTNRRNELLDVAMRSVKYPYWRK